MSEVTYTPEQSQAINDQDLDILVSASAGSGKTKVLVERVLQKILNQSNPTPVSKLLIVTFTEAAASEMKEKIQTAIEKALAAPENQNNDFLNQQLVDVQTANISTLHAFCLDVIRRFYYVIDLDPTFSLLTDETQAQLLREQSLANVFNRHFEEGDQEFISFIENFTGDRDFETAKAIILDLYYTAIAMPDYESLFEQARRLHSVPDTGLIHAPIFVDHITPDLIHQFRELITTIADTLRPELTEIPQLEKISNSITALQENIQRFVTGLENDASFDELREILGNSTFNRTAKSGKWDEEVKEGYDQLAAVRTAAKDLIKETWTKYFAFTEAEQAAEIETSRKYLAELIQLEREFIAEYATQKRAKNFLDFNDLEQFAYQILNPRNTATNNQMAQEFYQNKFAEILVDEYQDTNPIQEQIVLSIKKSHKNNMFMVGDVKQSIYAFRQAEPQLFMKKYVAFNDDNPANERITLAENFRSSKKVTNFVNKLFVPLMTTDFGELNYESEGQLKPAANYPKDLADAVEVSLFDKNNQEVPTTEEQAGEQVDSAPELDFNEIQMVIKRIQMMQHDHYQIFDPEIGRKREFKLSDIAILTPTRTNNLNIMEQFAHAGISLFISDAQNYFQTLELTMIMSYLKIIDNPDQDIPLVSVMRSPMYGFTEPELARIRISNQHTSFYKALIAFGDQTPLSQKVAAFLKDLNEFRTFEKLHRISELIWQIYEQTRLVDLVTGLPNGRQRRVNLQALYERASSYESAGFKGLYQFITFIGRMQKSKKDLAQPLLADAADNSVRLMTIHGSKGLEFPIVFLVGLSGKFNTSDFNADYIIDSRAGIGLTNKHEYIKINTVIKNALAQESKKRLLEEKARVLYVALTRAGQKLILICAPNKLEQLISKFEQSKLTLTDKLNAQNFLDLMGPQLDIFHQLIKSTPDLTNELQEKENVVFIRYNPVDLIGLSSDESDQLTHDVSQSDQEPTDLLLAQAKQLFDFHYGFLAATKTTAYQAVSEIKQLFNDPDIVQLQNSQIVRATNRYLQPIEAKPAFLTSNNYGAADIGTATHLILQKHDFRQQANLDILRTEISKLVNTNQLDQALADKVDLTSIINFLKSSLAKDISQHTTTLLREVSFSTLIKASNLFKYYNDEAGKILVHGTIDGYYETERGIVLFDYKTDHLDPGDAGLTKLAAKYTGQLRLYQKAIEEFTGQQVLHKYLIALSTNELIEID